MKHTRIVAFDHVSLPVRRMPAARRFYVNALGSIGMTVNLDMTDAFGMGSRKQKIFWISKSSKAAGDAHLAFRVEHREEVDLFYSAALRAGGTDNGAPGLRPDYGRGYYAAFVHDPEGNNIEVVCYGTAPKKRMAKAKKKTPE